MVTAWQERDTVGAQGDRRRPCASRSSQQAHRGKSRGMVIVVRRNATPVYSGGVLHLWRPATTEPIRHAIRTGAVVLEGRAGNRRVNDWRGGECSDRITQASRLDAPGYLWGVFSFLAPRESKRAQNVKNGPVVRWR